MLWILIVSKAYTDIRLSMNPFLGLTETFGATMEVVIFVSGFSSTVPPRFRLKMQVGLKSKAYK
jgi:hypothetical protein